MKRLTAIITYSRGGNSINAIRSLGKKGIPVIAIDSNRLSPGFSSKYTCKAFLHKNEHQDLNYYVNFLKVLFERQNCLTVFPMDELTAYILSKNKQEFDRMGNNEMPWADFHQIRIAQNRHDLFRIAQELDIPLPRLYTLDEIERGVGDGPWVIKPGFSLVEKNNVIVMGKVTYAANIDQLKSIFNKMKNQGLNPIIQEFIPGEGYGFSALYNKGDIRECFHHRRIKEASIAGGGASLRESVKTLALQREGAKIPDFLNWHGPVMVEFKKDEETGYSN